jgi:hypothetical protein
MEVLCPSKFYCCRRHNFAVKHFCETLNTFILLTTTCSSIIHTKHIVAFPSKNSYANSPHCYVTRALPIVFGSEFLLTLKLIEVRSLVQALVRVYM